MSNPYRDKLLSIGVIGRRTRDQVREYRRADGVRVKETVDQLGNSTIEHATKDDRVDVTIRAPHLRVKAAQIEERQ